MNVLSLFDGMSCGQIALDKLGIKVDNYFASEIDKYAIQVTQKNYPNTIQIGSVVDVKGKDLPKIDLLYGGSPCQSFSIAGDGSGFDGKSKLFWEFVRVLREVNPKYFLLENVRMKKEWQDIISKELGVKPIMINSSLVSAQNRVRYYWTNIPNISLPEDKNILIQDIVPNSKGAAKRNQKQKDGKNIAMLNIRKDNKSNCLVSSYTKKLNAVVVDGEFRHLTHNECESLQTLPINYTEGVSSSQRYKMLGNGWTVDVIAHIFKNIPQR
jgi:site-specific DNA-cytosine methylase